MPRINGSELFLGPSQMHATCLGGVRGRRSENVAEVIVLVDGSVWIRSLANQVPFVKELYRLLSLDAVAGPDLGYGELLIGDRGGRE